MTQPNPAAAARRAAREALREQVRDNAERMKHTPARGSDGRSGGRPK